MADNIKDIATKETKELQIRLLVCRTCKTIEELPDFDGPAEYDRLLQVAVEPHQKPTEHIGLLMKFPLKYWAREDIKKQIIEQIQGGSSGLDVFGTNFYATKMTFHDDAMKCYDIHLRPEGQCSDYKSDRKELKPGTDSDRKSEGLGAYTGPKVYMCDFCPVKMFNQKKAFTQKGLYE